MFYSPHLLRWFESISNSIFSFPEQLYFIHYPAATNIPFLKTRNFNKKTRLESF